MGLEYVTNLLYVDQHTAVVSVITDDTQYILKYGVTEYKDALRSFLEGQALPENVIDLFLQKAGVKRLKKSHYAWAEELPGVKLNKKHPITGKQMEVFYIIIDLNDNHEWSREEIADWIENVCSIDEIKFTPVEVKDEKRSVSSTARLDKIKRISVGESD